MKQTFGLFTDLFMLQNGRVFAHKRPSHKKRRPIDIRT
ncbi:Uncharacterised protein [Vibrio cholerae]|nr:Uncharacterised protein [Vibrio cholerae]